MRRGISFTMTLVVVAVILLATAFAILSLSGSSIGGFFDQISRTEEQTVQETNIRRECQDLAQRIDRRWCDQYVKNCNDGTPKQNADTDHTQTATEAGCDVTNAPGISNLEVTVQGGTYDCGDKGYISSTCPAD